MSDPCHDVMTNDYSAYSDELVGARLLHGVYDDAMSPEVSQRPLTGSPHNFLPCRAHGVQNCGSITPTSPSAVRLLSPISNHPRELTRMDGSHLHVYAPRVAHATSRYPLLGPLLPSTETDVTEAATAKAVMSHVTATVTRLS